METNLTVNPKEFGIEESKASELLGNLPQIKSERAELEKQYDEVIKMDIENPETSKFAKDLRKLIKDNRTKGIEVWHRTNKEVFLRGGQFVDAVKRKEIAVNERMESTLEDIEKYAEIKEQKRVSELKDKRIKELELYAEFVPFGIDLGILSDEEYLKVFNGSKMQYDAKVEADKKAEAERLENERLDKLERDRRFEIAPYSQFINESPLLREMTDNDYKIFFDSLVKTKKEYESEQEKIRLENERLKKEAEAKEKALAIERQKAIDEAKRIDDERQKELQAERDKQAKLEAELQAKKDAELKAINDKRLADEKAQKEAEKAEAKAKKEAEKPLRRKREKPVVLEEDPVIQDPIPEGLETKDDGNLEVAEKEEPAKPTENVTATNFFSDLMGSKEENDAHKDENNERLER